MNEKVYQCSICHQSKPPSQIANINGSDKCYPCMVEATRRKEVDAYLSEHGLIAVPKEPTEAMVSVIDVWLEGDTVSISKCIYDELLTAAGEPG